MKMIHIVDGPPLHTNCFLLVGSEGHAAVIDPAAPAAQFKKALEENGATLTHILLTHGHWDHVGSVDELREKYGARVYLHRADAEEFNLQSKVDEYYTDFETITVDDMDFKVIFTPGHTPGSVILHCGQYLFTGDTLFAESIGRTDFPYGDTAEMLKSLKKIRETVEGDPQVLPGHEEFSTLSHEKEHNQYLRNA